MIFIETGLEFRIEKMKWTSYKDRKILRALFHIADSIESFQELIVNNLDNFKLTKNELKNRDDAFEKWVSPMTGNTGTQIRYADAPVRRQETYGSRVFRNTFIVSSQLPMIAIWFDIFHICEFMPDFLDKPWFFKISDFEIRSGERSSNVGDKNKNKW